jgi:hypothetical protein
VDYEREPETELGDSSNEPEQPTTAGGDAAAQEILATSSPELTPDPAAETAETVGEAMPAAAEAATDAADANTDVTGASEVTAASDATLAAGSGSETDLDSEADILDDAFVTPPTPPEWPAADLANTSAAAADEAERDIAAAYAASPQSGDVGDDSDAPVLTDADADDVKVSETGVQSINAKTVTFSQGGAAQVHAEEMSVSQGGVGVARVGSLTLGDGASAFAVVADEATVESGSNAFLVVARSFGGDTQPTIDWRTAAAFGAGLGLVISIFRRIR